ncbi:MAG: hypothetical protein ACLRWP_09370 [Bilophila wadsworthia]
MSISLLAKARPAKVRVSGGCRRRPAAAPRGNRDQDGRGIAHDNHIHLALPIDDEADLTPERT